MRRIVVAGAWLAAMAAASPTAFADGAYFVVSGDFPPSTSEQQGYLIHFDGWETLCLQSNYRGPVADFAWVIPVPSPPEVSLGDAGVLGAMERSTRPRLVVERGSRWKVGCAGGAAEAEREADLGVTVLASVRLGRLDAEVLQATGATGLLAWLREHGYRVPERAAGVLQDYIRRGFTFVAVRFSRDELWAGEAAAEKLGDSPGAMVQLRFRTEKPYFPLAISSVAAAEETEILLFTVAEHRLAPETYPAVELRGLADAELLAGAEWEGPSGGDRRGAALRKLIRAEMPNGFLIEAAVPTFCEFDPDGRATMAPLVTGAWGRHLKKAWLTRFHAVLSPGRMKRDVYFAPEVGDERYDGIIRIGEAGSGPRLLAALVLLPLGWSCGGRGTGTRTSGRRGVRRALFLAGTALLALA